MNYDYECSKCSSRQEFAHPMLETPKVHCLECKGNCSRVILNPPPVAIPQHMQAVPNKFKYWNIDPVTGKGLHKDFDGHLEDEPPKQKKR